MGKKLVWLCVLLLGFSLANPCLAQTEKAVALAAESVVGITTVVPGSARTARYLGTERRGNGIVIDDKGLIVTIGYVILEAEKIVVSGSNGKTLPATFIGYDAHSGIGMVRTAVPLGVKPLKIGASGTLKIEDKVFLVQYAQEDAITTGMVVSRRTFPGYWEYLLENAIFASPPIGNFAGAALLNQKLELVGIGSLFVGDAAGVSLALPGNMFVPADRIFNVMADLITMGRPSGPERPWLGVNVQESMGRVFVTRVTRGGPAETAGLEPGDIILGVDGQGVEGLEAFYRKIWAQGSAGVVVVLDVLEGVKVTRKKVKTTGRYANYRLAPLH